MMRIIEDIKDIQILDFIHIRLWMVRCLFLYLVYWLNEVLISVPIHFLPVHVNMKMLINL